MGGRFINPEISESDKIGSLSPKSLALFTLLIPHFNAHGKMKAEINLIKGLVCPKIKWLGLKQIEICLQEISKKTNMRWFKYNGLFYIHSTNWKEHQPGLRRLGPNLLPEWSRSGPGVVPPEVDVDVDVDVDKDKDSINQNGNLEIFWKAYPKKKGKGNTEKWFLKNKPDQIMLSGILSGLEKAKKSDEWAKNSGQFIPHPVTWLNSKGWEDEYAPRKDAWQY